LGAHQAVKDGSDGLLQLRTCIFLHSCPQEWVTSSLANTKNQVYFRPIAKPYYLQGSSAFTREKHS